MQAPDRVFLKRAAECERMAELTRDPESKLFGGEWRTDGIGVRKWLQALPQKRHSADKVKRPESSARAADLDRLSQLTALGSL